MADLKSEVTRVLERNDYTIKEFRGCFDVAAKKDTIILVKVLSNVDSFLKEQAKNLKIISNNLDAYPLIVGEHTATEKLRDGIVYERYELPTISMNTFEDLVANSIFPKLYRDRGGLYVEIDSKVLKDKREAREMSQRELAESVGINKKVIYEHERNQLRMMLSIAEKLENILQGKITKPANILKKYEELGKPKDNLEENIDKYLQKIGFRTNFVGQAPVDVFAKRDSLIISGIETNKRKLMKRAIYLKNFIDIVKRPAVFITEESKEEEISGIPVISKKDLKDIGSEKEFLKIARKSIK